MKINNDIKMHLEYLGYASVPNEGENMNIFMRPGMPTIFIDQMNHNRLVIKSLYEYNKNGVSNNLKNIDDKKYNWAFLGTVHGSSRFDLLYHHQKVKNGFSRATKKFGSKDSLSSVKYYEILKDTKFLPIPHGYYHPETYRLYEALESGCIPVIENPQNFFDKFYPDNPILKIKLW